MSEYEFADFIDKNGNLQLLDGSIVKHEIAWRNSYDSFGILIVDEFGWLSKLFRKNWLDLSTHT